MSMQGRRSGARVKVIRVSQCVKGRVTWTAQVPGFIKGSFTLSGRCDGPNARAP